MCNVMERCHGNQNLLSVTEKMSPKASWKQRGVQRHGKASWKAIPVKRHGKAVMECVTETVRCAASWKRCHGKRRGRCDVMINAPSPTYRYPRRQPPTAGRIVPPTHCDPRSHPHTAVHIAPPTRSPTHLHRHSVTHALSAHTVTDTP